MLPLAFTFMDKVETWALTWMPILLMVALVYLLVNLLTDISYALLDPRVVR